MPAVISSTGAHERACAHCATSVKEYAHASAGVGSADICSARRARRWSESGIVPDRPDGAIRDLARATR
jgi:hypothetical protein